MPRKLRFNYLQMYGGEHSLDVQDNEFVRTLEVRWRQEFSRYDVLVVTSPAESDIEAALAVERALKNAP